MGAAMSALLPALLALIAAFALSHSLRLGRRLRMAEAAADAASRRAEGRGRCLGLVARELQGHGHALLDGPPAGTAAGHRLLRLADDIADYLAGEAGPRRLAEETIPLASLIEEAVAQAAAQLGPASRHWRPDPGFAALALRADRRALGATLVQLLLRAARLTREGEAIELRPLLTEDSLAIVIEDEGAGLPAPDLAAGAPPGTRGLGLGLATARALVEAHGGTLRLEALPGIGARAWLALPRARVVGDHRGLRAGPLAAAP